MHDDWPAELWCLPLGQLMHDDWPAELWCLPLGQLEHELDECELELWYFPAEHALQPALTTLYCPLVQFVSGSSWRIVASLLNQLLETSVLYSFHPL